MYLRKTTDEWILLIDYGQGYEEILTEDSRIEIRKRLKEYRENDYYAKDIKIIKKRVKKEVKNVG